MARPSSSSTSPTTTWARSSVATAASRRRCAPSSRSPRPVMGSWSSSRSSEPDAAVTEGGAGESGAAGGGAAEGGAAGGGAAKPQRLVVALVRGVHGLRGAVRIEVLTDKPEQRYRPGVVLHREGSDSPLTIASAEPVADGPGWRVRFREVATRDAADTLRGAYLET